MIDPWWDIEPQRREGTKKHEIIGLSLRLCVKSNHKAHQGGTKNTKGWYDWLAALAPLRFNAPAVMYHVRSLAASRRYTLCDFA